MIYLMPQDPTTPIAVNQAENNDHLTAALAISGSADGDTKVDFSRG
jgi:hypothetical protein